MRSGMVVAGLLWLAGAPAMGSDYLELQDLHLIDGTGKPSRVVDRLLVRDGLIVRIDDEGDEPTPEPRSSWLRIDLDGAWVMPGLVDTHVHVARFPDTRAQAERILRQAVRGGVTSVRDLGGDARALAELSRAMAAGEFIGPNLQFSALVGGSAVLESETVRQLANGHAPGTAPWARSVDASTDLERIVAQAQGSGVGNLKLYGNLSPDLARGLIEQARSQSLSTTAHATVFPTGPGELVDAGIGSLAHAPYLVWEAVDHIPADYEVRTRGPWDQVPADHPRLLSLYRRMAERGVFLDATLYVYEAMGRYSPGVVADWSAAAFRWGALATALARAAGVRVTTGTDWFEPAGDGALPHTHDELVLLVDAAGFTPMQAIVAATRDGAAALGLGESHGTLQVGKVADLLVLDADPLADIRNTSRLRFTVRAGRVVPAE
ncbi:amidohydrolase family protein [Luteimonas vadosa]